MLLVYKLKNFAPLKLFAPQINFGLATPLAVIDFPWTLHVWRNKLLGFEKVDGCGDFFRKQFSLCNFCLVRPVKDPQFKN